MYVERMIYSGRSILLTALAAGLLLAACGGRPVELNPEGVVEAYFEALVEKDGARMVRLSCASWEAAARMELDSYAGAPASLEGLGCEMAGTAGEATLVTCEGTILVTYGDEDQELSLEGIPFRTVFEAGEWRFCGF